MRTPLKFAPALTLLAIIAAPAFGQSFLGEWTATASTPGGDVSEVLTVIKTPRGYAVTANLAGPVPDGTPQAGPGTDIVLDGDRFSYKRTLKTEAGSVVITYSGVVSGDKFTGTVDMGFATVPYSGVRIQRVGQLAPISCIRTRFSLCLTYKQDNRGTRP
jgi:hypothetical protein